MKLSTTSAPQSHRSDAETVRKCMIIGLICAVVLLLAAAGLAWWQYDQARQVRSEKDGLASQVSDLQRQVDDAKSKEQAAEDAAKTADDTTSSTPSTTPTTPVAKTDEQQIIETTTAYALASSSATASQVSVQVMKQVGGNYARSGVLITGEGGYACYLKKSQGIWIVALCGQDRPDDQAIADWGFPAAVFD